MVNQCSLRWQKEKNTTPAPEPEEAVILRKVQMVKLRKVKMKKGGLFIMMMQRSNFFGGILLSKIQSKWI